MIIILFLGLNQGIGDVECITGLNKYYLSKKEIYILSKKVHLKCDSASAYRLYEYYQYYEFKEKEAVKWLEESADCGHSIAQYNLALRYLGDLPSRYVPINKKRAYNLLEKAMKGGIEEAGKLLKHDEDIKILINKEQIYWKNWILIHNLSNCPLVPFVLSPTKAKIDTFDKVIENLGSFDHKMLFVRINIDNGILQIFFCAWNKDENICNFVKLDGFEGEIVSGQKHCNTQLFEQLFVSTLGDDVVTDLKNSFVLDSDSMYLSLCIDRKIIRYASYDSTIDTEDMESIPLRFVKYLSDILNIK
jgi:hypothetical protein